MDKKRLKPLSDTTETAELFEKLPAVAQAALLAKFDNETAQFLRTAWTPYTRPNLLAHLQELGLLSEFLEAENGTQYQDEGES